MEYTGGDEWVTAEAWTYKFGGFSVTVPCGYRTDLASIPRVLWSALAPFELSVAAPLLHDYLYRCQGVPIWGTTVPETRTFTRAEIDRLFLAVMEREGVGAFRRRAAYLAVRAFGWAAWRQPPGELVVSP